MPIWISIELAHCSNSSCRPLGHIFLISSQPVFALSPLISGEATNTNSIVFGLTRSGLEHTIYRTLGEHPYHFTIDAVIVLTYI